MAVSISGLAEEFWTSFESSYVSNPNTEALTDILELKHAQPDLVGQLQEPWNFSHFKVVSKDHMELVLNEFHNTLTAGHRAKLIKVKFNNHWHRFISMSSILTYYNYLIIFILLLLYEIIN
ncbi:uncharacterized protein VP01_1950g1 [Puccinia sorghi]|uniref:Uncharacterized protein n=1 Tax=Puccinia sorghi TaxID=27349 RepID=A0A0L6VDY6_9BASI|nr:uncharacterized protein VP01_1950g1 [Puccinia sorghi]